MGELDSLRQSFDNGTTDPVAVAERFLAADPVGNVCSAFIAVDPQAVLAQARESKARLAGGEPRGPLEGALVGIKDFIHVADYPTRAGTSFLAEAPSRDAAVVTRLRDAGAIIAGKTRMTELGLSPLGLNTSDRSPRNPHDPARITGGSSSGSAAAVAAGLVPIAVGSDGGGSLRIPPSLCGVLGLKPTFGRINVGGELATGWWSLEVTGPIAGTTPDLAIAYAVMAGIPPPDLDRDETVRVGVDWAWWGIPDDEVDRACRDVVEALSVTSVHIDHLELIQPAAYATVLPEVASAMELHLREAPQRFGADVRIQLQAATRTISAVDYVRAQQARTLIAEAFAAALTEVDVLVVPMTATAALGLPAQAWMRGRVDEALIEQLTRYAFPANLTGFPALTVPVGTTRDGMPVGLQLMGRHGEEATLLRLARRLEREGIVRREQPRIWHDQVMHG